MQSEIPVLNLDGFLANKPGALKEIASELKHAAEYVGFYFIPVSYTHLTLPTSDLV